MRLLQVTCASLCLLLNFHLSQTNPVLPTTFGHAHKFHPLPDTVVGAHCPWEVRLNTVYNRIPPIITEIVCLSPHSTCGGNTNFKCRQINTKMTVGYTNHGDLNNIEYKRNATIAVGCSCVMNYSNRIEEFRQHYIEKKSHL